MKKIITLLLCCIPAFSFLNAQLQITNGAEIKMTGNAVLNLQDINLVNDGTFNQTEGTVRFTGNTNTSISGTNAIRFYNLQLAKTVGNKVSLLRTINADNEINFTTGNIDLNGFNILLSSTALLAGENDNSRITGISGGYVQITNILNAPSAFNSGNLGAVISSAQNLGSTVIRRGHTSQVNGSGTGNSIHHYFDIIPTNNTALNATLRINYFDTELNGLAENTLAQWKSSNNTTWFNIGFSTRDAAANYVTQTGLADFSRGTLSSLTNPLPVNFILFNADCNNNLIVLTWKTAQEQNSRLFEIQKSEDGISFNTIATVAAAGTSSTEKMYTYTDNTTSFSTVYYRIVQQDIDGRKQYTSVNQIRCGEATNKIKYWPNPVQSELFLSIPATAASVVSLKVFDSKGALVLLQQANLLRGTNQIKVNTGHFTPGSYTLLINRSSEKGFETIKLIKQ